MYTEYTVLVKIHKDGGGDLITYFTYNNFRMAWYAYLQLLDIDIPRAFICGQCGSDPEVILMVLHPWVFARTFH